MGKRTAEINLIAGYLGYIGSLFTSLSETILTNLEPDLTSREHLGLLGPQLVVVFSKGILRPVLLSDPHRTDEVRLSRE